MDSLLILGRQPQLGMAELESLYGSKSLQPVGSQAVIISEHAGPIDISRLGGTMKLCKIISFAPSNDWAGIIKHLASILPQHLAHIRSGKLTIGISVYGIPVKPSKINADALSLKKALKTADRGVRIVPNKQPELNTAQVIHNQLTKTNGIELVVVKSGKRAVLAQTIAVQDIDAYAARDQARPARDAKVGMLPPKLAQIIINLATGSNSNSQLTILDPFCGTGVVLQEAWLMGYGCIGSDLDSRMIEYSQRNMQWLLKREDIQPIKLTVADATSYTWGSDSFDAIACETYLGRPLSSLPSPEKLREIIIDVDTIHKKFLHNVARQTQPGFRMCVAVPAWKTRNGFQHLPALDHLTDLGYNRLSFVHAETPSLVYHRPEQLVARELVILERK